MSILPVSREAIEQELAIEEEEKNPQNVKIEVAPSNEESDEETEEQLVDDKQEAGEEELFEKPKKKKKILLEEAGVEET